MIVTETSGFYGFSYGNMIEVLLLLIGYMTYRADRKKDANGRNEAREKMVQEQTQQHTENKNRLELVMDFTKTQREINEKRDAQIGELKTQTMMIAQIAASIKEDLGRRVSLLEDAKNQGWGKPQQGW